MRLLSRLQHPGIVDVLDLDDDGESCFAVLGLVDGPNLKGATRLLAARGAAVGVDAAVGIAARVADALHVAHELLCPDTGAPLLLVHRDVNPPNILLGRGGVVKLADFGVALSTAGRRTGFLSAPVTEAGVKKGRASALAPEQVRGGPVDRRADLWSLGVALHATLTGALPFGEGSDAALFDAILTATPPRLVDVRPALGDDPRTSTLQTVLDELLQKDPAARPPTAAVVAARLHAVVPAAVGDAAVVALVDALALPSLRA
jgi:serine/threonine-protein kinase